MSCNAPCTRYIPVITILVWALYPKCNKPFNVFINLPEALGQARYPIHQNLHILNINNIGFPQKNMYKTGFILHLCKTATTLVYSCVQYQHTGKERPWCSVPAGCFLVGSPCIRRGGPFPFPLLLVESSYNVFLAYISHKACSYTQVTLASGPFACYWLMRRILAHLLLVFILHCMFKYLFLLCCISYKACSSN